MNLVILGYHLNAISELDRFDSRWLLVEMDFLQLYRGLHLEHLVLDLLD